MSQNISEVFRSLSSRPGYTLEGKSKVKAGSLTIQIAGCVLHATAEAAVLAVATRAESGSAKAKYGDTDSETSRQKLQAKGRLLVARHLAERWGVNPTILDSLAPESESVPLPERNALPVQNGQPVID